MTIEITPEEAPALIIMLELAETAVRSTVLNGKLSPEQIVGCLTVISGFKHRIRNAS
jgi:hypothetical protein